MSERRGQARLDDDALGAVLASVGEHLVTGPGTDGTAAAGARQLRGLTAPSRRRLRLLAIAAALVVGAAISVAVPPVRQAVADWMGLGSTRVERVPEGEGDAVGLPTLRAGAVPLTAEEARRILPDGLPDTSASDLGPPDQLFRPPEGGVLLVWARGSTTLWAHHGDIGAGVLYRKLVSAGEQVRPVEDLGDSALLITGSHFLVTPARRLAAGSVLLWSAGGLEYRLESDLGADALIAVARSL
jgi:hypothetical protein